MRMRYTPSNIPALKERTVFFDANAIIYIFWPITPDSQESIDYGSILATLLRNNLSLAINESVISEIHNRILKLEFKKTGLPKEKFKNYRDSDDGISVQSDLNAIIKDKILTNFQIINEPLSKDDLLSILNVTKLDFNDKLIELLCKKKNMILLTHDSDFSSSDVDILTANSALRKR